MRSRLSSLILLATAGISLCVAGAMLAVGGSAAVLTHRDAEDALNGLPAVVTQRDAARPTLPLQGDAAPTPIHLGSHRQRRITGHLVRAADDSPLVTATRYWFVNEGGAEVAYRSPTRTTRPDGSFDIADVPPDATHMLFPTWSLPVTVADAAGSGRNAVSAGINSFRLPGTSGEFPGLTLRLETGDTYAGLLRGPRGRPVVDAHVRLSNAETFTASDGRFVLHDVLFRRGATAVVAVSHPAFVSREVPLESLGRAHPDRLAGITLAPAGSVEGCVVDAMGAPLRRIDVMPRQSTAPTVGNEEDDSRPLPIATTDGAGEFRIDGLPPGRIAFYQATDEEQTRPLHPLQVEVVAGRTTHVELVRRP